MAPAKTGRDSNNRKAVTKTDHTNSGRRSNEIPGVRIFITVVMNFIDANIDDAPARCNENIAKSTEPPACARPLDKGG